MKEKKEITIYDIAQKLNLSSATISRALNDNPAINKDTRKRVQSTAKELGYRHNAFASSLRKQATHTIGVLVHELNSNFITSVLAGIEKVTTAAGFDILIAHSSESIEKETANASNLYHKRVDGLIASLSFETTNLDHFKPYINKGIPVVFFDRVEENFDSPKVIIDNYKAGYQATQHLIEQGCKKIVLVTASLKRNVYFQRHRGYKDALYDNSIKEEKAVTIKGLNEQSGREAALQIIKMKPLPDGIFVTNDFTAAVCIQTFKEYGIRIPEDIAVVGFNNDVVSKIVEPQLTTINYPGLEIGENAARSLIGHIKGDLNMTQIQTIIVKSELIIRDSSLKKKTK